MPSPDTTTTNYQPTWTAPSHLTDYFCDLTPEERKWYQNSQLHRFQKKPESPPTRKGETEETAAQRIKETYQHTLGINKHSLLKDVLYVTSASDIKSPFVLLWKKGTSASSSAQQQSQGRPVQIYSTYPTRWPVPQGNIKIAEDQHIAPNMQDRGNYLKVKNETGFVISYAQPERLCFYDTFTAYSEAAYVPATPKERRQAMRQRKAQPPSLTQSLTVYFEEMLLNAFEEHDFGSMIINMIEYAKDGPMLTQFIQTMGRDNLGLASYLRGLAIQLANQPEPTTPEIKQLWLLKRLMLTVMLNHLSGVDIAADKTSQSIIEKIQTYSQTIKNLQTPLEETKIAPSTQAGLVRWAEEAKPYLVLPAPPTQVEPMRELLVSSIREVDKSKTRESKSKRAADGVSIVTKMPSFAPNAYQEMIDFAMMLSQQISLEQLNTAETRITDLLNSYPRLESKDLELVHDIKFTDGRSDGLFALDATTSATKLAAMLFLIQAVRRAKEDEKETWFGFFRHHRDMNSKIAAAMLAYQTVLCCEKGKQKSGGEYSKFSSHRIKCAIPENLHEALTSDRLGKNGFITF